MTGLEGRGLSPQPVGLGGPDPGGFGGGIRSRSASLRAPSLTPALPRVSRWCPLHAELEPLCGKMWVSARNCPNGGRLWCLQGSVQGVSWEGVCVCVKMRKSGRWGSQGCEVKGFCSLPCAEESEFWEMGDNSQICTREGGLERILEA